MKWWWKKPEKQEDCDDIYCAMCKNYNTDLCNKCCDHNAFETIGDTEQLDDPCDRSYKKNDIEFYDMSYSSDWDFGDVSASE